MMVRSDLDVSTRDARCKCGLLCQGEREVKAKENELMEMCVVVIELIVQGTIKWATVITFLWRRSQIGAVVAALWPCRTWATLRFLESLPGRR